jgi:hypothetical protein
MNKTTEYKDADAAWMAGNEWILKSDKWEKMDFLMETASPEFKDNLINELMKFMSEFDTCEFFNHLRRNWGIKTPQELDYEMNS